MRIVLIGFTIVLLVLSCALAIRYNQDAMGARHELDNERYKRMVFEEGLQAANTQVNSLTAQLDRAMDKIDNLTEALDKTRGINAELKDRLDTAAQIQSSLDKKIVELQRMASPL